MQTRHFNQLPKPYLAYPKIIQSLLLKKTKKTAIPELEYVVDQLKVNLKHLAKYKKLTGFTPSAQVPALYCVVLAQSLQMHMMTHTDFPFAVLGLVHIRNQITQHRPLNVYETISLSCRFGQMQAHEKGVLFDFETSVRVGDEVVIEGVTTYLSRQKNHATITRPKESQTPVYILKDEWRIEEDIGRHYAMNSGDFNLIHLHALSAKAFGFKKAIAHGMWSKAKILARLELPARYSADVWFKLPIYLPSNVELLTSEEPHKTEFLLRSSQGHKPHVVGVVQVL